MAAVGQSGGAHGNGVLKGLSASEKLQRRREAAGESKKRNVVIQGFERNLKVGGKRVAEALERGVLKVACPEGEPLLDGSAGYKVYKAQYKRLCTHLRQNASLAPRLASGELSAETLATMSDEALLTDTVKNEREQFRKEGLQEALGINSEDSAHWTPSADFTCPRCETTSCVYIQWFKGSHSYDDNNVEPAITVRCTDCKFLWKEEEVEGGRAAAGTLAPEQEGKRSPKKTTAPAPAIWGEDAGRETPNWLLPASL